MRAVTWPGQRDVRVSEVPDPTIEAPTDAIIKVTSTNICGSDLEPLLLRTPKPRRSQLVPLLQEFTQAGGEPADADLWFMGLAT
jgi:threonine dehydrogenase-like Zn-dependent dehydrogenase